MIGLIVAWLACAGLVHELHVLAAASELFKGIAHLRTAEVRKTPMHTRPTRPHATSWLCGELGPSLLRSMLDDAHNNDITALGMALSSALSIALSMTRLVAVQHWLGTRALHQSEVFNSTELRVDQNK